MRHYAPTDGDRRLLAVVWLTVAAASALDAWWTPRLHVVRAEDPATLTAIISAIIAGLGALFGGKVDKATKRALEGLRAAVVDIATHLTNFASKTDTTHGQIAGVLIRLWDNILLPFFRKADGRILKIYNWLKETFGPIVQALLWLRKHVLDFYNKFFRPILDTIDAIRGVLRLLGLLHVEFAQKLDDKLARLEARIMKPLRVALETINQLIDWTERIITVDGFFQRYTLIRSLLLHERDALKVWWHTIHQREIDTAKPADPPIVADTAADFGTGIAAYAEGRDDKGRARADEWGKDLALALRGL